MRYSQKTLEDKFLELLPINKSFLCSQAYNNWINDLEVNRFSSLCRFPVTDQDKDQLLLDMTNKKAIHWSISYREKEDSRPCFIGTVSLQEIDMFNRSAELAIKIGLKSYWDKGIGFLACSCVLNHAFNRLNLNRIWVGIHEMNKGMIKLAQKIGMQYEGSLRQSLYSEGCFYNIERYSLLEEDYLNSSEGINEEQEW